MLNTREMVEENAIFNISEDFTIIRKSSHSVERTKQDIRVYVRCKVNCMKNIHN